MYISLRTYLHHVENLSLLNNYFIKNCLQFVFIRINLIKEQTFNGGVEIKLKLRMCCRGFEYVYCTDFLFLTVQISRFQKLS